MNVIPAPFEAHLSVDPAWLDLNGHMNVAFYMTAFDRGSDPFFDELGLGWSYTQAGEGSIFVTGANMDYRQELLAGDPLRVTTQLLDYSAKLIHLQLCLYQVAQGVLAATQEILFMHISLATRRSAPLPVLAQQRLAEILRVHQTLTPAAGLGRTLAIQRR